MSQLNEAAFKKAMGGEGETFTPVLHNAFAEVALIYRREANRADLAEVMKVIDVWAEHGGRSIDADMPLVVAAIRKLVAE